MEKVSGYISELLMHHDCVVIPELGGFVGNYKPAVRDAIRHTFHPPSKAISFNKNLVHNDGLLANHLVQQEEISYEAAMQHVVDFVLWCKTTVKEGKKVSIDRVGDLFLDPKSNQIQFHPSNAYNYLQDAYGFAAFQKFPIKREKMEERIVKEFKDRAPVAVATAKKSKKWRRAVVLIPLLFLVVWMPMRYDLTADLNYANLNPFDHKGALLYQPRLFAAVVKDDVAEPSNEKDVTTTLSLIAGENPIAIAEKEHVAKPDSTYVAPVQQKLIYHIIGGCFSEKRNAKRMVKRLKKKGFDAWIIGKRKGLWAVSYQSFATREESLEHLALAKEDNQKAWLLKQ